MSRFGWFFGRLRGAGAASAVASPTDAGPVSFDWSVTKDENTEIYTLLNEGAYEQAETVLRRQHDADPTSQRVINLLADVAERRENWKEALYWRSKISFGRDEKWRANLPRVRIYARQGRPDQARQQFSQILERYDGNGTILLFASQVLPELDHEAQGKFAAAIRPLLQEIVNRSGESSETLVARANIARCEGRVEEVYACLKRAHLLRPQEAYLRALALEAGERAGIAPDQLSL